MQSLEPRNACSEIALSYYCKNGHPVNFRILSAVRNPVIVRLWHDRTTKGAFLVLDYYSLSRKTVNARENFWNVYCFTTNQMRDETAKDNRQTAEWINYDLTRNNEFAFSSTRNL